MLVAELKAWLNNFDDNMEITGGPLLEPITGAIIGEVDDVLIEHEWDEIDDDDDDDDDD